MISRWCLGLAHLFLAWYWRRRALSAMEDVAHMKSELDFLPTRLVQARRDAYAIGRRGVHHARRVDQLLSKTHPPKGRS